MRGCIFQKRYKGPSESRLPYILKSPLVTERSTLGTQEGRYTFKVDKTANKIDIKAAVEKFFDVTVVGVNTLNVPGKKRRFRGIVGRTSSFKKAVVRLKEGQVIDATGGGQ
jgi:large subunit ribosomal protein L23